MKWITDYLHFLPCSTFHIDVFIVLGTYEVSPFSSFRNEFILVICNESCHSIYTKTTAIYEVLSHHVKGNAIVLNLFSSQQIVSGSKSLNSSYAQKSVVLMCAVRFLSVLSWNVGQELAFARQCEFLDPIMLLILYWKFHNMDRTMPDRVSSPW